MGRLKLGKDWVKLTIILEIGMRYIFEENESFNMLSFHHIIYQSQIRDVIKISHILGIHSLWGGRGLTGQVKFPNPYFDYLRGPKKTKLGGLPS